MKRARVKGILLFFIIAIILTGCSYVRKIEKNEAKEVTESYIKLRYNQNYENIDNTQKGIKEIWYTELTSDNSYLKEIKYESKLKDFKYKDIEKGIVKRENKDIDVVIIYYEVSYKENSINIKDNLKDTLRIDEIQVTLFKKDTKWLLGQVSLVGSKNVLEADVK